MTPTFKDLVELARAVAWPFVVLLLAFVFRGEVRALFRSVLQRATKVSGLGMAIEMAGSEVATQRLIQASSPEEKAEALRELEMAKVLVPKFDHWMREYHHPPGKSDKEQLLDWLDADRGARYVSGAYGVFKALAEVAAKMGYDTVPPPSYAEFQVKLTEAADRDRDRQAR